MGYMKRRATETMVFVVMPAADECGWKKKTGTRINRNRSREALDVGADQLVTGCPYCLIMSADGVAEKGGHLPMRDVATLLQVPTPLSADD